MTEEQNISVTLPDETLSVLADLAVVRGHQIAKGWTPEHDDFEGVGHLLEELDGRMWKIDDFDEATAEEIQAIAGLAVAALEVLERKASS